MCCCGCYLLHFLLLSQVASVPGILAVGRVGGVVLRVHGGSVGGIHFCAESYRHPCSVYGRDWSIFQQLVQGLHPIFHHWHLRRRPSAGRWVEPLQVHGATGAIGRLFSLPVVGALRLPAKAGGEEEEADDYNGVRDPACQGLCRVFGLARRPRGAAVANRVFRPNLEPHSRTFRQAHQDRQPISRFSCGASAGQRPSVFFTTCTTRATSPSRDLWCASFTARPVHGS
mmetsp:Transcript_69869/g.160662  ORF Transcript_69869/g.160662 Transcript_69869/m.160662 type:complete len:228 (-) Transcript_69869:1302-1985(-)